MNRTKHHRNQKHKHCGHDYGSKYKCNKGYSNGYGVAGRNKADKERRSEGKIIIRREIN